jgi:hypothetical protein
MANFLCVRAQRTGGRLHKWKFTDFLIACNFWVFGEAIQLTTDYPQGQRGGRDEFALAHYLFISRSRRLSQSVDGSWLGTDDEERGRKDGVIRNREE